MAHISGVDFAFSLLPFERQMGSLGKYGIDVARMVIGGKARISVCLVLGEVDAFHSLLDGNSGMYFVLLL